MQTSIQHRQQGAVLIVALVFLVILTMLGVTAMTGTTLETRMAGNTRDLGIAVNAAEAAIVDAEWDIGSFYYPGMQASIRVPAPLNADFGAAGAAGTCSNTVQAKGLCRARFEPFGDATQVTALLPQDMVDRPGSAGISLSGDPSVPYGLFTGAPALKIVSQQPRYFVESLCALSKPGGSIAAGGGGSACKYYRITARGYGANPNTRVTLSEVYTVR